MRNLDNENERNNIIVESIVELSKKLNIPVVVEGVEGEERKAKIGHGDRSEKIRTYNYPQNRLTDHRIGYTVQQLDRII